MPPAKKTVTTEDSRSDASTVRERQIAAAAHARKSKQNAAAVAAAASRENGSALKELAAASADADNTAQAPGVSVESADSSVWPRLVTETDRHTDGLEYDTIVAAKHIPSLAQPLHTSCFHITTQPSAAGKSWNRATIADNGETEG